MGVACSLTGGCDAGGEDLNSGTDVLGRESCKIPGSAHKARNCTRPECSGSGLCYGGASMMKCEHHGDVRSCAICINAEYAEATVSIVPAVRKFETGATRDTDTSKYDYEGFLSPLVVERYAEYMHKNRHQRDGTLRASDNWQKGIPLDVYMKSLWRHFMSMWKAHRRGDVQEEEMCAILFNTMGYLHEHLKAKAAP